jgi:uncharacterized protein
MNKAEQVAQLFEKFGEMQEAEEFEPREFITQGDKVVALGHYRWRIRATGRSYESGYMCSASPTEKYRTSKNT